VSAPDRRRQAELGYPNFVNRKAGTLILTAALGAGAAVGVGACGEERGGVEIEGGTGTDATGTAGTGTGTVPTAPTETERTTTAP
jgi:hypothetical protein